MNATIKFSKKESTIINGELERILDKSDKGLSVKANMINLLCAPPLALTRDKADEVAEKIVRGVTHFNQNLGEACFGDDSAWLDRYVDKATIDLTDEEKYNLLLNLLVTIKAVDAQLMEENLKTHDFQLTEKYNAFREAAMASVQAQVTAGDLAELEALTKEALENTAVLIAGNREIADLIEELAAGDAAAAFVENNWNDAEFKCYTTLATYIAYTTGEINSIAVDADPELVAVGIAAGIERDKIIKQASLGEITWEVAKKTLKIIGIVASATLLGFVAFQLTVLTFSGALLLGQIVGGALAIASGLAFGGYLACRVVRCVTETGDELFPSMAAGCDKVREKLREGFQTADGYVRETVCPSARNTANKAWEFLREKLNAGIVYVDKKLEQTQPEEAVQTEEDLQPEAGV